MIVLVLMMMTASAFVVMLMFMMMSMFPEMRRFSGTNHSTTFNGLRDLDQLWNQCVGIFSSQAELFRGKGDNRFLDGFVIVEFLFDLCGAVGAVQIFNDVYFSGHPNPSLNCINI